MRNSAAACEAEPGVPADVIYHAPKGQTIAGVARDHFRGDVHLQALSSGLNSVAEAIRLLC
jgi:hypothetical protein